MPRSNGLAERARFEARNLFELTPADLRLLGTHDKWLVDPPREGAFALAKALAEMHQDPGLREGFEAAATHRLRQLQPGDARTRCRTAGAPGGLPLYGSRRGQHVPAHGTRGKHRGVRSRQIEAGSIGSMKKGPEGPRHHLPSQQQHQSLLPPPMPNSMSRDWNTL